MKINYSFILLLVPSLCIGSNEISSLKALNEKASKYRLMAIECVTDVKLTKKQLKDIHSCKNLYDFTTYDYPDLKSRLITAQEKAKKEGDANGLEHPGLREQLILIMSAKSHMNIAGTLLNSINQ